MRSFYTDTVTRDRAGVTGGIHGGDRDWSSPDTLTIDGVRIQPIAESAALMEPEDLAGAVSAWRLFGPYGIDIRPADRITWTDPAGRTRTFEVIGDPQDYRSPTGGVAHSETTLRSISG